MSFTAELTQILRVLEQYAFGAAGRTTVHRIDTLKLTGGLRQNSQLYTLSAGVSNQELNLTPITASDPGAILTLQTNQPLDLRLNASNASMVSSVRSLVLGASISALFVTVPGLTAAAVRIEVMGGGSVVASTPVP